MKAGELYTLYPWVKSGIVRTNDIDMKTDEMEYLSIGQDVPVLLLEMRTDREYHGYWKVLVQDQVGWVHQSIMNSHYCKIGNEHESR
jgi:hypothetical protein